MRGLLLVTASMLVLGAGCASAVFPSMENATTENTVSRNATVELPIQGYVERRTAKDFGEYISDRFVGYHVGDDIEYEDVTEEVPVVAISDGAVERVQFVSGYGGFVLIKHSDARAIYGHLDLGSVTLKPGDAVTKGQFIGNLGADRSQETDGERKHLHFGLYTGDPLRVNGYEQTVDAVHTWINPTEYFESHGLELREPRRRFTLADIGGNVFNIEFMIPEGMEVEYVPSIQALNIFTFEGEGTARERSQMFIRYFDASDFQTLSTVTVHSTENLTVGDGYTARRYDIEKRANVADFAEQPDWRNERHVVTDVRGEEGRTRYYVIAANPALDQKIYEAVLDSLVINVDE